MSSEKFDEMARSLSLADPHGRLPPLRTPCFIIPTEFGLIPYVTPDVSGTSPLYFYLADFLDNNLTNDVPIPISLGLGQRWTFLGMAAEFNNFDDGPSPNGIRLTLRNGSVRAVSPDEYAKLVTQFAPHGVVAPFSQILPDSTTRQRKLRVQATSDYAHPYPNSITFVSDNCDSQLGLYIQCGQFTTADIEHAIAKLKTRPSELPRMLFFDGHPEELRKAVFLGFDLFVLRLPFYFAERGVALVFELDRKEDFGELGIDLRSMDFANDHAPICAGCDCKCCRNHARSYVHHLLDVHELLAKSFLVQHNITHYERFLEAIRDEIETR
jgi:hypothetical protein